MHKTKKAYLKFIKRESRTYGLKMKNMGREMSEMYKGHLEICS